MAPDVCPAASEPTLSFTQGLIVGQLSVVLLVAAFIKFFIFGDTPSAEATAAQRAADRRLRTEAHQKSLLQKQKQKQPSHAQNHDSGKLGADLTSPGGGGGAAAQQAAAANRRNKTSVLRRPPTLTIGSILNKTYYRVDSHQPESLDWFNVLIAQTIAQFRHDAQHDNAILTSLTKALNGTSRPEYIDEVRVTELSLGEDFPIFSNCRIIPVDEDGLGYATSGGGTAAGNSNNSPTRLQARMDVDLSDMITLAIETKMLLNYPRRLSAVLPVAMAVSVVRFSGTLSVSFVPSNPSQATPTKMIFAFLDDYRLDFSIRSLLGSRSRLQDVPKIAQLVESRLHRWFDDRAVEPRFQEIALPSLWPRMRNARGGSGSGTGTGGGGAGSTASGASGTGNVGEDGPAGHDGPAAAAASAAANVASGAPTAGLNSPSMGSPPTLAPTAADRMLNKAKSTGLDALRRPESRDSRDSRETRDPRKEAETESWVERQQSPLLQSLQSTHIQSGQVPQLPYLMRDTMRYRQRSRQHDEGFSRPGSIPDVLAEPHG